MSEISKFPRAEKVSVGKRTEDRLIERLAKGPPEPALDSYIGEIKAVVIRLESHVDGVSTIQGTRAALLATSEESNDIVDTWFRKIESFIEAEALRRTGPNNERARKLYAAVFPQGRGPIEEWVVDKNVLCRSAINALQAPENAEALTAIEMPEGWITKFEAAVAKSDADYDALAQGRVDQSTHIDLGRDAERDWEDVMTRFRHHVAQRAKRNDVEKKNEGRQLLDPLLSAMRKHRAEAAARRTIRTKQRPTKKAPGKAPEKAPEKALEKASEKADKVEKAVEPPAAATPNPS